MALMTAAQARLYIPALSGTAADTDLDSLIGKAARVFAYYLGFPPNAAGTNPSLETVTYTQTLDGPGGVTLKLPVIPIQSVTSIHDDPDRAYGSGDLVAASDYEVDLERGLVILKPTSVHGNWSTSYRAIRVVYVAGFATTPGAIVHAGGLQIAHWWGARNHIGKTSISQGGGSASVKTLELLPEVKEALAPYRMPSVFIG